MYRIKRFRLPGETLIEVTITITILTIILSSIFGIIAQASSANVNVVNRVVALNIAREGIEAVRNIRDTNWLKYSGDRRGKWLCLDTTDYQNACEENSPTLISGGIYTVDFSDTHGRYYLERQNDIEEFSSKKIIPAGDFRLYQNADERFLHAATGNTKTIYYRQILLETDSAFINPSCATNGCPKNERLRVLVRVQWREGKGVRSLDLETYLYDYLGKDSY
jgi:type II secretory pathway pseudopilin PulG